MRIAVACVVAMIASACQTSETVSTDRHTGITVVNGDEVTAHSRLVDSLRAKPFYSSQLGYAVSIGYSNYGWTHLNSAYSFGRKFDYLIRTSTIDTCGGIGGCITTETGIIKLDKATFDNAGKAGLEFKLIGRDGSVTGRIPAESFRKVSANLP